MPARGQQGDRPAHRVAGDHGAGRSQLAQDAGGVVGAVLEVEVLQRADAAPVAAVIEREHAEAGVRQRSVLRVPVEVRRHGPAVQQQHGRPVAAAVAHEALAPAGDLDGPGGRHRDGRLRRVHLRSSRRADRVEVIAPIPRLGSLMRLAVATIVALLAFASPGLASQVTNLSVDNANPSRAAGARTQYAVGFTHHGDRRACRRRQQPHQRHVPRGDRVRRLTRAGPSARRGEDVGSCSNPTALTIQCSLFTGQEHRRRPGRRASLQRHHESGDRRPEDAHGDDHADQDPASTQYTVVAANPIDRRSRSTTRRRPGRRRPHAATSSASPPRPPAAACPAPPTAASTSRSPPAPPSPAGVGATVRDVTTATNVGSCANPGGWTIQCSLFASTRRRRRRRRDHLQRHHEPAARRPPTRRASVSTTSDPPPIDSAQFTVVAASPITVVDVDNTNPSRARARGRRYVVGFTTSATGGACPAPPAAASRHVPHRHHLRRLRQRHRPQPHHRHQRRQLRQPERPRDPVLALLGEHDRRRPQRPRSPSTASPTRRSGHRQPRQRLHDLRHAAPSTPPNSPSSPPARITAVTVDNTHPSRGGRRAHPVRHRLHHLGHRRRHVRRRQQPLDVTFPTGTTFAGYASATVRNLTTATNVGSCCNPSGLVDPVPLFSANAIGAGHNVAITFNGITNPPFRAPTTAPGSPPPRTRRPSTPPNSASSPVSRSPRSRSSPGVRPRRRPRRTSSTSHLELRRPVGRCQQPDQMTFPEGDDVRRTTRTGRSTT